MVNTSAMADTRRRPDVRAAGAVVLGPGKTVLLVHRPKYDDWSFPKGKLERGEHPVAAAVREVAEETGLHVRLGPALAAQRYPIKGGMKTVDYWTARPVGGHDVSSYRPNDEIDAVRWVPLDEAPDVLTYDYDHGTLREARKLRRKTRTLVVLRHGKARSRKTWRGDDRKRPLLAVGRQQSERLVPLLAAYDLRRLVSSSSTRCTQSLEPYAQTTGWKLRTEDLLSEEDAKPKAVRRLVAGLVEELTDEPANAGGTVVCSHRPVLPWIFEALRVEDPELEVGEMFVVHLRKGDVVATERHLP